MWRFGGGWVATTLRSLTDFSTERSAISVPPRPRSPRLCGPSPGLTLTGDFHTKVRQRTTTISKFWGPRRSVGPHPITDFGLVLKLFLRVRHGLLDMRLTLGYQCRRSVAQARHPPYCLRRQMEPAHRVEHDHLERRSRRALFVEAAHMDAVGGRVPVHDFVYG